MTHAILILTTGGTIDKQYFDALSRYQITDTIVTKLLTIARVTHPFLIEEILRKDSIDLTHEDRSRILHHVTHTTHTRIIITHGADTMTLTAQALNRTTGRLHHHQRHRLSRRPGRQGPRTRLLCFQLGHDWWLRR